MRLTGDASARERTLSVVPPLPVVWSAAAVVGLLLIVFLLDRSTAAAPVQHLYYLPIILAGIYFRLPGGLAAALAAIALYHLANPSLLTFRYQQSDFLQIALFIAIGIVTAKLTSNATRLRKLAMTDDLTGLHNLRSFEVRLSDTIRASRGAGTPVSMLVFDVDRLKSLNDQHGHLAGAEAVRTVGYLTAARLPPTAIASRYGGDEFVIALPGCDVVEARRLADDLRAAVCATAPILGGISFPPETLSISVGLACRQFRQGEQTDETDDEAGEALFRAADAALYRAKEEGRNRVSVA
jgi:diguanylate cyclase (GGDEF)-like protein